jgi:hypothetical protein
VTGIDKAKQLVGDILTVVVQSSTMKFSKPAVEGVEGRIRGVLANFTGRDGHSSEMDVDAADGETTGTVADVGIVSEPLAQHAAALLLCASIAKIGDFHVQTVRLFPLLLPLIFFSLARL